MTVDVTLHLPEMLLERVQYFSRTTQRNVETVMSDALEMMWPMLEETPWIELDPPAASLSDQEVMELADLKMDPVQNQRLGQLQTKGKAVGLSMAERYELLALLQIYQRGQLRKSEGLSEAVRRGLRQPLPA